MSTSAKRLKSVEFSQDIPEHEDRYGNVYNLTRVKKRRQRLASAQLRTTAVVRIAGKTLTLPYGQIIVFHRNGNPSKVRVENLEVFPFCSLKKAIVIIDSSGTNLHLGKSTKKKTRMKNHR